MSIHGWEFREWPGRMAQGWISLEEAALVAGGFEGKAIGNADGAPACFSRPVMQYAMSLGLHLPDDQRRRLASFVFRLSGTADRAAVENARFEFLWVETRRRICQPFSTVKDKEIASTRDAVEWGREVRRIDSGPLRIPVLFLLPGFWERQSMVGSVLYAVNMTHSAIARLERPELWAHTFDILDGAIKLGRDEPVDAHLGAARLRAARQSVAA
jgi:hypothetical protein